MADAKDTKPESRSRSKSNDDGGAAEVQKNMDAINDRGFFTGDDELAERMLKQNEENSLPHDTDSA